MSAASKALPRPCPTCGEVSGGVFCPSDGTPLEGAFSLGGDRYVVEELIGNGAMAIVFGGRHRTLSRPVAVKILRPEVAENADQQQRFLREARSASQLNHENIVGVLDFGWDDDLGVTYMVMERMFGQTLASEIGTSGRMGWREAMPLLIQICRGLGAAHGLGIVHRDLTSRNVILVVAAGRRIAKLCDFGLSRQAAGGDRVTHNGAWVGTPAYMAPEQLEASPTVEASADIYSIGVLAHELLTGHFPVGAVGGEGVSAVEMVAAKLSEVPRRIALRFPELGIPDELDSLILRCLEIEPEKRPTAAELERALVRIEARSTTAGAPLSSLTPPSAATPPFGTPGTFPSLDDSGTPAMIGSYRVVRSLGAGGTGRVYLGEHPVIGSKVAIKVLLPEIAGSRETVERFIQEARTSSQIESPHIPRYYDFGRTAGGLPYAVMEYFEGETLAERIEKHGALSVAECADILGQVAGALTLAHEAGLVHRDLKPENIFLVAADPKAARGSGEHSLPGGQLPSGSPTGLGPAEGPAPAFNVKVLDFGIAKTFGKESGTRTQQGFFLGTPFYCAPEQVFGAEVDPRADVYGLGATAFEMLTGLPPFVGEISEVLEAKTSREAPLVRNPRAQFSELVEATVARMLARDPAARAPSMTWVKEQVARWTRAASSDDVASAPGIALARTISQPVIPLPGSRDATSALSTEVSQPGIPLPGSRAAGSSPAIGVDAGGDLGNAATQQGPHGAPYVIEAARPRRGDEPDFDALETVTMLPGARAVVQITPPPVKVPVWRRPIPLAIAAAMVVGGVAVLVLGPSPGGASSGALVAPMPSAHAPKVSPIADPSAKPSGRAAEGAGAAGSAASGLPASSTSDDAKVSGDGKAAALGEGRAEEDGTAQGDDEEGAGAKGERGDRNERKGRPKRDRADKRDKRDRQDPATAKKDPEPPKDVKFVDPFSDKQ